MTRTYDYQSFWNTYTFPEGNDIALDEDVQRSFNTIKLDGDFSACGIPLLVKGNSAVVNNETENTIIFGETGCKKTRSIIAPLLAITAGAGESAFVTDVKGELSTNPRLQGYLKSKGVNTVYLDFRSFGSGSFNILEPAFRLYKDGECDKAMGCVLRIVSSLVSGYNESTADPYWKCMSEQYLVCVIQMLFEICMQDKSYEPYVNMLSVSSFACDAGMDILQKILDKYYRNVSHNVIAMLRGIVCVPEKTRSCIVSTVSSILKDFVLQEGLVNMLSSSSFSLEKMYSEPTFVFLIVPDETSAYDGIAGLMMDAFYSGLIDCYSRHYQNSAAPKCRINFICDEFCNLNINEMGAKISASRSRYMRWFLVCQSKSQLDNTLKDAASTIIGNCKNTLFLQSADTAMLSYIRDMCGRTKISENGLDEPLISTEQLKSLKMTRQYKEALFIRDDLLYFATLPDLDCYDFLTPYASDKPHQLPKGKIEKPQGMLPHIMLRVLECGNVSAPFITRKQTTKINSDDKRRPRAFYEED